jgi:hypothetical protein
MNNDLPEGVKIEEKVVVQQLRKSSAVEISNSPKSSESNSNSGSRSNSDNSSNKDSQSDHSGSEESSSVPTPKKSRTMIEDSDSSKEDVAMENDSL